ncbi:MAG: cytochrome c, partial [Burkholderiaceae bacterium]|nr:cytochrome c [Burkholderiaceae bacterium]
MLVLLIGSSAAFTASAAAPPADASPSPAAEAASASKDGAPFDLTDPERIATGKKRFNANCAAYCHGAEGSGGKTPPFRGNKDFNAQAAFKVITDGRRAADVM